MTDQRRLAVYLEQALLGEIREANGIWEFVYDKAWATSEHAFAVGPGLPLADHHIVDGGSKRPVQWFFDNLLPEENLRTRLARERAVDEADAFGLLEAYGAESAGALTLVPPGTALPARSRTVLTEAALAKRVRELPKETLEAEAPKKMSLAGAQNKLPVILDGDSYFEPVGSEPSTHILKPNHPDTETYPASVANEWAVMQVAARVGLSVPPTLHRYCPSHEDPHGNVPIFLIERFDRVHDATGTHRLHAIDACQLLSIDRTYKSRSMTIETLSRVANATRSRGNTRLRLFQWALYNVLVANRDAHLKNLSFLVNEHGIELAPHYDLLSTALFDVGQDKAREWMQVPMSLELPDARTYAEVSRAALVKLAAALNIGDATAERMIQKLVSDVPAAFDHLIAEFEKSPYPASLAVSRAAELRVLRQIRHVVVAEMTRKLSDPTGASSRIARARP